MAQLLNLLAAIALLVWSTQFLRAAILEGFGSRLRYLVARAVANRASAVATGMAITLVLQSGTATTLLVAGFVGQGILALPMALAIVLGADVGASLAAALLALGRGLVGLGLLLLALHLISDAAAALVHAPVMRALLATLADDAMLAVLTGVVLTLAAYSSLAIVLLTATLAAAQALPVSTACALVVGANIGSGLAAVLTLSRASVDGRRLALANLLCRLGGALVSAPLLAGILPSLPGPGLAPGSQVIGFHVAFNLGVALLFVAQTERLARMLRRWLAAPVDAVGPQVLPSFQLDPASLAVPRLAIAGAARLAVHQADVVETMLRGFVDALRGDDLQLSERMRALDDTVDALCSSIKHYLARLPRETLGADEARRLAEVLTLSINLEQVADMVEIALKRVEKKKIRAGRRLSAAGLHELCELHARLMDSMRLAVGVFLHRSVRDAWALSEMKQRFGELERACEAAHFDRLSERTPESMDTSSLHLDLINDLARMNSRVCAIGRVFLQRPDPGRPVSADDPDPGAGFVPAAPPRTPA
ncbi:Na/Pi cotransporter family protein [Piscinibacter sakaiensis]|uniref:Na/Pi cotransporter family protein n=1 Tax=Piscinibacter sakaiensis TaxID=1547922 RepID=UPI0037288E9D